MPDDPDLDDALRAVWTRRRPLVLERLGVVEDALADGLEHRLSDEGRAEAERAAHQIAGSAGTFGFADASVAARGIEHALREDLADPSTLLRVAGLAADLRAELEASAPSPDLHARAGRAAPAARPGTATGPADDDALDRDGPGPGPAAPATAAQGPTAVGAEARGATARGGTAATTDAGPGPAAPGVLLVAADDERTGRLADALDARGLRTTVLHDADGVQDALAAPGLDAALLDVALAPDDAVALELVEELADELPTLVVDRHGRLARDEVTRRGGTGPAPADADVPATAAELSGLLHRRRLRGARVTVVGPPGAPEVPVDALRGAGLDVEVDRTGEDVRLVLARTRPELVVLVAAPGDPDDVLARCRVLRNDPRRWRVPVVLVAGADGPGATAAAAAGADDLVPADGPSPVHLAVVVRSRLERTRALLGAADDTAPTRDGASPAPAGPTGDPAGTTDDAAVPTVDVVLVEDDPTIVALLEHAMDGRGLEVRHYGDGLRASAALAGHPPEVVGRVVLLDWDLPGVDGLRVLRAMGANGALAHSRVIMLTARAGEREVLQALEAGATDHVAKPFSLPVLLERVRGALRR